MLVIYRFLLVEFKELGDIFRNCKIEFIIFEFLDSKNILYLILKLFMILLFEINDLLFFVFYVINGGILI